MLHRRFELKISPPRLFRIGQDTALLVWDQGGPLAAHRTRIAIDGTVPAPPLARVRIPTRWSSERCLLALRWPEARSHALIELKDEAGEVAASVEMAPEPPDGFDPDALLAGLAVEGRIRLIRYLLETVRSTLKLGSDPDYAAAAARIAERMVGEPGPAVPRLRLPGGALLCTAVIPAGAGNLRGIVAICGRSLVEAKVPAEDDARPRQERRPVHFVLPRCTDLRLIALIGDGGVLFRRLAPSGQPFADALAWLGAKPSDRERAAARGWLTERAGEGDHAAAALAHELDLFAPAPAIALTDPNLPVNGELELAIEDGTGHVFLAGWLRDPLNLVAAMLAGGESLPPARLHLHQRGDSADRARPGSDRDRRQVSGFLARAACVPGAPHSPREIRLRLKSGTELMLRAKSQALSPAAARDAVLAAIPDEALTEEALAAAVLPSARALNARHLDGRRATDSLCFGPQPAAPALSVIVPLYRNLDFLRFQVAAFAMDAGLGDAEFVYVLDSPEQREQAALALRHLAAIYDLPLRLVVLADNYGYAAANNLGAACARGRVLALLNSDVVPDAAGWFAPLAAMIDQADVGACGARLLFDDGSLQHAGMYFAPDDRGAWRNRHFFKGLPRDFVAAGTARRVPALTGACLAIRREVFERLGGFDEGYLVGDYEDSDLCLRLDRLGLACRYVPQSTLYHFERQSVALHRAHARGVASECNRVIHDERWRAAMADAMARFQRGYPEAAAEAHTAVPAEAPARPAAAPRRIRRKTVKAAA